MSYREIAPPAALSGRVACFWTSTAGPASPAFLVLPDGAMDVLVQRHGDRMSLRVVGAMTSAQRVVAVPGEVSVGVRFVPGEASGWLGVAARELRDTGVELEAVWGPAARELQRRLGDLAANDAGGVVRVLGGALLERLPRVRSDRRLRAVVGAVEASGGRLAVRGLAASVGLSERSLERLFHERVGVGPKLLGRVVRLQRLLRTEALESGGGWAAAAATAGYADQAHLAREVRALCGVTPGQLRRERLGIVSERAAGQRE